eukprot:2638102-Rhodomonas_salina.1
MSTAPPATDAVLVQSVDMPEGAIKVQGYDFNKASVRLSRVLRRSDEPVAEDEDDELKEKEAREKVKTTVMTASFPTHDLPTNMASCGVASLRACYAMSGTDVGYGAAGTRDDPVPVPAQDGDRPSLSSYA